MGRECNAHNKQSWKFIESFFSKRNLTLFGRITVIQSLLLRKFIHLFLALPNPPGELIKKWKNCFINFYGTQGQIVLNEALQLKIFWQEDFEW